MTDTHQQSCIVSQAGLSILSRSYLAAAAASATSRDTARHHVELLASGSITE